MRTLLILFGLLLMSLASADTNIAFGTLKGIKVYDFPAPGSKVTKLYFADDATLKGIPECNGVATITHGSHDQKALNQFMSIALLAYSTGSKVRAFSLTATDTCELDFLALQEEEF